MTAPADVAAREVAAGVAAVPATGVLPVADAAGRGRTQVSGRALRSVAAAAAAVALGVPRRDVHVDLTDDGGRLAVVVRTPVLVADGDVGSGSSDADGGSEGTVVARAEAARQQVARALAELAGAGVGSCRLVVTAVSVARPDRFGVTSPAGGPQ